MKKIISLIFATFIFAGMTLFCYANDEAQHFADVGHHPYTHSIETLYDRDVVKGYEDGTFKPNNTISRAEFLKVVMESLKTPTGANNCFSDVKEEWFAKYVCGAHEKGIIQGYKDGTFKPGMTISFAEASKIIDNLWQNKVVEVSEPWYKNHIENLANNKAIPFTITGFDHLLTRGEMAEIIVNMGMYNDWYKISLSYEDLVSLDTLSPKANFVYRFQKAYRHELNEEDVPDGVDFATFQRIMLGTSACGLKESNKCELVESELYRDANRIYNYPPDKLGHRLMVLEEADAATFEVHPDIINSSASDKNNIYTTDKEDPFYHKSGKASELQNMLEQDPVVTNPVGSGEHMLEFVIRNSVDNEWVATELNETNLVSATVKFNDEKNPYILLKFDEEGGKLFEKITEQSIEKQLAIFVNGEIISSPTVMQKISGGEAQIAGNFTTKEAEDLAKKIESSIPVKK